MPIPGGQIYDDLDRYYDEPSLRARNPPLPRSLLTFLFTIISVSPLEPSPVLLADFYVTSALHASMSLHRLSLALDPFH